MNINFQIFRLFKQAARLLEESSDFFTQPMVYKKDIKDLENIFVKRYPGEGLGQSVRDVADDFKQSGFRGVAVEETVTDEEGNSRPKIVGYFYGYKAVPDEEIPVDLDPENVIWHSGNGESQFPVLMQALIDGKIFYASNLVIDEKHRLRFLPLVRKLLDKVKENYDYIAADMLEDSARFLFDAAGNPNPSNMRRAGLELICSFETGYSKFVVLKINR